MLYSQSIYRSSDIWRLCRPGEAPTPLPCVAVEPPENTLTTKEEIRWGEISKNKAKSFSGGASGRVRPQALGLSLHGSAAITLEVGSRFFVERSQICKTQPREAVLESIGSKDDPVTGVVFRYLHYKPRHNQL